MDTPGLTFFALSPQHGPQFAFSLLSTSISFEGNSPSVLSPPNVGRLAIPHDEIQQDPDVFSFLRWQTGLSDFYGRDQELYNLKAWANSPIQISAKFVIGPGGVGKSRLAAEFARLLKEEPGWEAGFVQLRSGGAFKTGEAGTLVIIDYPEENNTAIDDIFRNVANMQDCLKLRILLLTRQSREYWIPKLDYTGVGAKFEKTPVHLIPHSTIMRHHAAYEIFRSCLDNYTTTYDELPIPVSRKDFKEWLNADPEYHGRPLFIVAAAINKAINRSCSGLEYRSAEIIDSLVRREIRRLCALANNHKFHDNKAICRLLALAALSDGLSASRIENLSTRSYLMLGLPDKSRVFTILRDCGVLTGSNLPAPQPDIVAACLLVNVFKERSDDLAPEWLWAAIEEDIEGGLKRVARLAYDAENVLGMQDYRLSLCLRQAIINDARRAHKVSPYLSDENIEYPLNHAGVVTFRTVLQALENERERARALLALSYRLTDIGDDEEALSAVEKAVEIVRYDGNDKDKNLHAEIALCLHHYSVRLGAVGRRTMALKIIEEACRIRRHLYEDYPREFEAELARSLNNYAVLLGAAGERIAALSVIFECVCIRRDLARRDPQRVADLAHSLNNLSDRLASIGRYRFALHAATRSVAIRRQLSDENSAMFFGEGLAISLRTLSDRLAEMGDIEGALEAISESVRIRKRLSQDNRTRFAVRLARSLTTYASYLLKKGEAAALEIIEEAVHIYDEFKSREGFRSDPEIALALKIQGTCRTRFEEKNRTEPLQKCIDIYRELAGFSPKRYEPEVSDALKILGIAYRSLGMVEPAKEAFQEAIELIEPYARSFPKANDKRIFEELDLLIAEISG